MEASSLPQRPVPHEMRQACGRHLLCWLLGVCALLHACLAHAEFDHSHKTWNALLQRSVVPLNENKATAVRYNRLGGHNARHALDWYLGALSAVPASDFNGWRRAEQLAFLINAYNAHAVKLVLDHYPIHSIKDVEGVIGDPWQRRFFSLLGAERSLEELEQLIGAFAEPRVHFALYRAAAGCPMLRNEAYVAERLEAQLEEQARQFLADGTRNRFDVRTRTALVSPIFEWYADAFTRAAGSVKAYLARYADALAPGPEARAALTAQDFELKYLPYDWRLNDAR